MQEQYNFKAVETAAQEYWDNNQVFRAVCDDNKEKFYCLSMFPYPSGRLHMGHVRNYTIGDVIARYQRLKGKNVLQPIGWDAFGLPAENAAIKNKVHPASWTRDNIATMKGQLKKLGFAYDWQRELSTCEPSYYRWEQWLFTKLFEKGLVYKKNALVNWDPIDKTVLANEQVIDGRGWRSGALVEKKEIPQWFLKITAYADELLDDLKTLTDGWPKQVLTMQHNWIGRSEGININFNVRETDQTLTVFTTRPDTLMGVTYLTVASAHPIAQQAAQASPEIATFIESCNTGTVKEEEMATVEKKGIDTGMKAIHPITGEAIPIWVGNYVLMSYGSGAVMAVPAHDERDYAFAQTYQLAIRPVIRPENNKKHDYQKSAFVDQGILINSGEFDGLTFADAFKAILKALEKKGAGSKQVNFRLHDWGISRQRYWGTPVPIIYCDDCGPVAVPEKDLPVVLPENVTLDGHGSPLAKTDSFYHTTCPRCGKAATRDTDTFDTFVESSWYYARYTCPQLNDKMLDDSADYWLPVDQYIGGIEHAVMHLLYARFFHKLLRDEGLIKSDEPFQKLLTQGMVLKDGAKMSKSKGNVVDPNDLIEQYGADTVRLFSMFAAPPDQSLEWQDNGVEGAYRFLKRFWKFTYTHAQKNRHIKLNQNDFTKAQKNLFAKIHHTLNKAIHDIEQRNTFNTVIASVMELINHLHDKVFESEQDHAITGEGLKICTLLLAPIVPHITHTLWQTLEPDIPLETARLPTVDQSALLVDEITLVVQINGKLRAKIDVASDASRENIEKVALAHHNVAKQLENKTIKKIIIVPKKLINIVA